MNPFMTYALFKRNFKGYFSTPTGYVFICVFVLLSAFATFWPNEFFNANLANFDQFNRFLPWIMLIFIPAITMSIWAEERREGTDELVLTIPASDLDVVLGKYLSAVAIFTVALLFSFTNVFWLDRMGDPDFGILGANYLGYWLIGVTMLSIGMVASFLTRNLTVAFILGVVFNAPLVFAAASDSIFRDPSTARFVQELSIANQFQDFGRGVVTFSSCVFFLSIPVITLYLSMVMIGRRHWSGQKGASDDPFQDFFSRPIALLVMGICFVAFLALVGYTIWEVWQGEANLNHWLGVAVLGCSWLMLTGVAWWFVAEQGEHYLVRALALAVCVIGINILASRFDKRWDASVEGVSSLAPETLKLIEALQPQSGKITEVPSPTRLVAAEGVSTHDGEYVGAIFRFTATKDEKLKTKARRVARYDGKTRTFIFNSPFEVQPQPGDQFVVERPQVQIQAFVSPGENVPEQYVQPRLNLLNALREFDQRGGDQIELKVYNTEQLSEEARRAEEEFGINPQKVLTSDRGSLKESPLYLGVAFTSGQDTVTVPFFDRGLSPEYEIVRSLTTISQQRKKLGVVTTDVKLFGQFNPMDPQSGGEELIIKELRKQFDVVQVDVSAKDNEPIPDEYDVLLAVQPSTLGPEQTKNFIASVSRGIPTAIFEDPFPYIDRNVPGASQMRRAPQNMFGGMFGGQQPPPPKGNLEPLWEMLGVSFFDTRIVFNRYNPFPKFQEIWEPEFVFASRTAPQATDPFNPKNPITNKLSNVLFIFPGALYPRDESGLKIAPLAQTNKQGGYINFDQAIASNFQGMSDVKRGREIDYNWDSRQSILAVEIQGEFPKSNPFKMSDAGLALAQAEAQPTTAAQPTSEVQPKTEAQPPAATQPTTPAPAETTPVETKPGETTSTETKSEEVNSSDPKSGETKEPAAEVAAEKQPPRTREGIHSVVVADIDVLYSVFFQLRSRGEDPEATGGLNLDNVTFVLNLLDGLAGENRFIPIRSRRPAHRTLSEIEKSFVTARQEAEKQIVNFRKDFEEKKQSIQTKLDRELDELEKRSDLGAIEKLQMQQLLKERNERELERQARELQRTMEKNVETVQRDLVLEIREQQTRAKLSAVCAAPILPLSIGLLVFFFRRLNETRGVSAKRLR